MRRYVMIMGLLVVLATVVAGCVVVEDKGVAIKTLVVENETTPEPDDVVVKLRWSFDQNLFRGDEKDNDKDCPGDTNKDGVVCGWGDKGVDEELADGVDNDGDGKIDEDTRDRFRFPECGFDLYRDDGTGFKHIDTFKLPPSVEVLKERIAQITDKSLKARLVTPSGKLTKEGRDLSDAIEAAKKGDKKGLPAYPTGLLMLASIDPNMAEILGLLYIDTVVESNKNYTYKLEGVWSKAPGKTSTCSTSSMDQVFAKVKTVPSEPLPSPLWADDAGLPVLSLEQLRRITFDKAEQLVTGFWGKPKGEKRSAPPIVPPEPVVEIRWEKTTDDFVGYHVDRWTAREEEAGGQPTRINRWPKKVDPGQKTYLILSEVNKVEEKPERFLDDKGLQSGTTYVYRLTGVDLFGRKSRRSRPRSIVVTPMHFPPVPPQRICLESYDPEKGALSDTCPKSTPGSPAKQTWSTPGDLKQPVGTEQLWIRLKWRWSGKEQKRYRGSYFNVYRNTSSCSGDEIDNDKDMRIDEEFPNGKDDDLDGKIDEDLAVTGKLVVSGLPIVEGQLDYEKSFLLTTDDPKTKKKEPVMYYYFCLTTISKNIDDDNDGRIDEDPPGKGDDDGDCPGDTNNDGTVCGPGDSGVDEDSHISESTPSIPVLAYVVDKIAPKMPPAACQDNSWVKLTADPTQSPDWQGKLAVSIDWKNFADNKFPTDIDGYHLYRAVDDGDYVRLNRSLIESPLYMDHIEATAQNKFYYKFQAVDKAGNVSVKSDASCPVKLPDKIPPTPAQILGVSGGNEQITVKWEPSSSTDAKEYGIYRGNSMAEVETLTQDKKNRLNTAPMATPQTENGKEVFTFTDGPVLEAGADFYYVVEAIDANGNRAFSRPATGRAYDINPPGPPSNLKAKVTFPVPVKTVKENTLVRVVRVTPAKVGAGETFPVKVLITVKADRIERVSISEDLRGPFKLSRGSLDAEWLSPERGTTLVHSYDVRPVQEPVPGKYLFVIGTADALHAVPSGHSLSLKWNSEVEMVQTAGPGAAVELSWNLPERKARAEIWRCVEEDCKKNSGPWRMITPLQSADEKLFKDTDVYPGAVYYYKVGAYDKVGNRGEFSEVLKVKVE